MFMLEDSGKKRIHKLILTCACICITMFMTFILQHQLVKAKEAEVKIMSIPKVNFEAQLMSDGSAKITETWTLDYQQGDYTRFGKEIRKNASDIEKIKAISDLHVLIDGVECGATTDTKGRPPYCYNLKEEEEDEKEYYTLSAYSIFKESVHTVVFQYTLKGVVKSLEGHHAVFCYRFIGKDFEKKCDQVNIKIIAPHSDQKAGWKVKNAGSLEMTKKNSKYIQFMGTDWEEMAKVKVWLKLDMFEPLVEVAAEESNDKVEQGLQVGDYLAMVAAAGMLIAVVILIITRKKRKSEYGNPTEQVTNKMNEIANEQVDAEKADQESEQMSEESEESDNKMVEKH